MVVVGLSVALFARSHYEMGTAVRMGPGYFPSMLGWILAALGVVVSLLSLRSVVHVLEPPPFAWRSFIAVVAALLVFALLIDRLGLIPTAIIAVVVAALAGDTFQWRRAILLGIGLAVLSWLIFSVGLQMTLPAFAFLD